MNKRRLLILVNCPAFFMSHRAPLAVSAAEAGYEVHVATMPGAAVAEIKRLKVSHHELPLSRSGTNPGRELLAMFAILRLMRSIRPDLVHLVTIKPVLYGGLAARLSGVPGVIAAISGLGFTFLARGWRANLNRALLFGLYRLVLARPSVRVIFQNPHDRDLFVRNRLVSPDQVKMIRGSGVDLDRYALSPEPAGRLVVLMPSRLLMDKGIREFVEAAQILRSRNIEAEFRVAGGVDPDNPASISLKQLELWRQETEVKFLGYQRDMPAVLSQSHVVVLPSYREGLPKVLLEAAACGRAVVTTDVPGCRDAIEPGETGVLVPAGDALMLAEQIQRLLLDHRERKQMGQAARKLAEREFSIESVVAAHLSIYQAAVPGREAPS